MACRSVAAAVAAAVSHTPETMLDLTGREVSSRFSRSTHATIEGGSASGLPEVGHGNGEDVGRRTWIGDAGRDDRVQQSDWGGGNWEFPVSVHRQNTGEDADADAEMD